MITGWSPRHRLLFTMGQVALAGAFASGFVSFYLLQTARHVTVLIGFAAAQYAGIWAVGYLLVRAGHGFVPRTALLAGISAIAAFYGLLFALGPHAAPVAVPLGFLLGLGSGVYWFAANLLIYDAVPLTERVSYYAASAAVTSLVGVVAPILGALVITHAVGGRTLDGYRWLFLTALGLYASAAASTTRLIPGHPVVRQPVAAAFRVDRLNRRWRWVAVAQWATGYRQGVLAVAPVLLIYLTTGKPFSLGLYGSLTQAAGVLSARWMAGHGAIGRWRREVVVGVTGAVMAVTILIVRPDFIGVLGYGLLTALFQPIFSVPVSSQTLRVMDEDPDIVRHRPLYILSRENGVNGGRLLGLLTVLGVSGSHLETGGVVAALLASGLALYALPWTVGKLWGTSTAVVETGP
jgi:YQGE family putative transporter